MFRRVKMMRSWGGIVDNTPDRSAIQSKTPVPGLYVDCGCGNGRLQGDAGFGQPLCAPDRPRRAAQVQCRIDAGALPHRTAHRRSGSRRRRALTTRFRQGNPMLLIYCPYCQEERSAARIPWRWRRAYCAAPRISLRFPTRNSRRISSCATWFREGPDLRTLAAHPRLRPFLQCGARHHQRQIHHDLQGRRAKAWNRALPASRTPPSKPMKRRKEEAK